MLEQRAEIGVCGRREFVRGVSGRSSCERGRRREKRCHDTKVFGGDGRLVGLVLLYGRHDWFGDCVGHELGFPSLGNCHLGIRKRAVLALLVDQKRLARLCGGAPNVPQLAQIDIDLDGLMCGIP